MEFSLNIRNKKIIMVLMREILQAIHRDELWTVSIRQLHVIHSHSHVSVNTNPQLYRLNNSNLEESNVPTTQDYGLNID